MLRSDGTGKGTCTCTCETKPVSSSSSSVDESPDSYGVDHPLKPLENTVPQSAALMRTATRPRHGSTAAVTKTAKQPKPQHQTNTQYGGGAGIIDVPPMQDYGLGNAYEPIINEQSNFVKPVDESQHQQQQQQEEQKVEDAQQHEYAIFTSLLA